MLVWALLTVAQVCAATGQSVVESSPHFLPELSSAVASFPADEYEGRSFRVFGAVQEDEKLKWREAQKQCVEVGGLGLARVFTEGRKKALDHVIAVAERALPQRSQPVHWIGTVRRNLSDPNCLGGSVQVYPYFVDGVPESYNGCGQDDTWDWAWVRPQDTGGYSYLMWRDVTGFQAQEWWDKEERTNVPGNGIGNPGGFSTQTYVLSQGYYENCTVALVYGDDNPDVFDSVRNKAFWRDWGCEGGLARWVCEMPDAGDDGGSDGTTTVVVAVTVSIAAVLLVAAILGALYFKKRRRDAQRRRDIDGGKAKARELTTEGSGGHLRVPASLLGDAHSSLRDPGSHPAAFSQGSPVGSDMLRAMDLKHGAPLLAQSHASYISMTNTTEGAQSTVASHAESEGASAVRQLQQRLLALASNGEIFGGRYLLQMDQHVGGQSIVHFAVGFYNGYDYACKFFLSAQAFQAEALLYQHPTLQQLLPKAEDVYDPDSPVCDAYGTPFPPCIVMEKGEGLTEWSRRAKADFATSVQVLSHLAGRLATMHKAGLAHRSLKPSNVMWLPRENKWTVIDFGCTAAIGSKVPIAYSSLSYVAPEVVQTLRSGEEDMVLHESLDCWSLGVLAFELLTGSPAFSDEGSGHAQIMAMLAGEGEALPWEADKLSRYKARQLGVLRKPVLQMLSRDPGQRPTMTSFQARLDSIFGSGASVTVQE